MPFLGRKLLHWITSHRSEDIMPAAIGSRHKKFS
jgi:hypothetical protein